MEIHHHPRHSEKSRNYKEYIFEFLVIFVAIIGSFFAENIREHYVDKHKAKEYMESMLGDLKYDSASLTELIVLNKDQVKGLDSLLKVMEDPLVGSKLNLFYYLDMRYTLNYNIFGSSNRSLSQLKNTGDLRLIKVKAVSDGIANYEMDLNVSLNQSQLLENQFNKIKDQQSEIIDFLTLKKLVQKTSILQIKEHPALVTSNTKTIHAYYFNIFILKGVISSYIARLTELKKQTSYLMKTIQKEYNLE